MKTTTTTTTTARRFPLVRRYADAPGHRRASIAVFDDGDERFGRYRISISHECWTGARWLAIHQEDEASTFEDAAAIARRVRDRFGWVAA